MLYGIYILVKNYLCQGANEYSGLKKKMGSGVILAVVRSQIYWYMFNLQYIL